MLYLLHLIVLMFWLTQKDPVYHFNRSFKRGKLHHGVGDLSTPKRDDTLVKSGKPFRCLELLEPFHGITRKRWVRSLYSDFEGFPRTQKDVCHEFGRCGSRKIDKASVLVCTLFTHDVRILVLEILVKAVFSRALE